MSKSFINKKARFDYFIENSFEAGISLLGKEIKAIRSGRVNLIGSYVKIINSEIFWLGGVIEVRDGDKQRTRKLLIKKEQIKRLIGKTEEKGLSLVPLKLYFKKGRAKLEVGVCRGKKRYDKRQDIKEKEFRREKIGYGLK